LDNEKQDAVPDYPDTATGTLMRQRDQLIGNAEQDEGMSAVYADKAKSARDRAAQLQAAIDAMPPDPT